MSILKIKASAVMVAFCAITAFAEPEVVVEDDAMYVTDPMNGFDEEVFLQEQAKKDETIAHANAFLKTINGSQDE